MQFSVLTYNTLFNTAFSGFQSIFKTCKPDIICLQEVDTSEQSIKQMERLGFKLADYSNSFIKFGNIYGVATFYNESVLTYVSSQSLPLPKGIFGYVARVLRLGNDTRTILKTLFVHNETNTKIVLYNIHLTPFGPNGIRMKQLKDTIEDVDTVKDDVVVLAGDFNYPYGRKKLEEHMQLHHLTESTSPIITTIRLPVAFSFIEKLLYHTLRLFFRNGIKADYMFHKNCKSIDSKRINVLFSDHYPIITTYKVNPS